MKKEEDEERIYRKDFIDDKRRSRKIRTEKERNEEWRGDKIR